MAPPPDVPEMAPADSCSETGVVNTDEYVERVLAMVERVPAGRVTTYGLIAEAVGCGGPRQVGRVMARHGGPTPWWRVVRADGSLPRSHRLEAFSRYREESTALRGDIFDASTLRVDLGAALWDPGEG